MGGLQPLAFSFQLPAPGRVGGWGVVRTGRMSDRLDRAHLRHSRWALASHVFIVRRGGEIFCKAAADFGASGVKGLGESTAAERLTKWKSAG